MPVYPINSDWLIQWQGIFYSSGVSFADPSALVKGSRAISSLMGNVDQQHVDAFKKEIEGIIKGLNKELRGSNRKGKIQLEIAYLKDLIWVIEKKVLQYQQNPAQRLQLQNELEAIARSYGGKMYELIWSLLLPPAVLLPAPLAASQPDDGEANEIFVM